MSGAIDFKELLKMEKLRIKKERISKRKKFEDSTSGASSKTDTYDSSVHDSRERNQQQKDESKCGNDDSKSYFDGGQGPTEETSIQCAATNSNSLDKILQCNKIESNTASISDVYYIKDFLSSVYVEKLSDWLKSLPHADANDSHTSTRTFKLSPSNQEEQYNGKWTRLKFSQRNVALFDFNLGSTATARILEQGVPSLRTQECSSRWPLLQHLCDVLVQIKAFPQSQPPNHVLVNEYQGDEGILPHTDGPTYLDRTATFSISGGDVLFRFSKRGVHEHTHINEDDHTGDKEEVGEQNRCSDMEIKLHGNGSLVVFTGEAYTNHCHSINDRVYNHRETVGHDCVNADEGEVVSRGHRISLTFRHKYRTHV